MGDQQSELNQLHEHYLKELKARGLDNQHLRYLHKVYWGFQHQHFLQLAESLEKSRSGQLGGRGKKRAIRKKVFGV